MKIVNSRTIAQLIARQWPGCHYIVAASLLLPLAALAQPPPTADAPATTPSKTQASSQGSTATGKLAAKEEPGFSPYKLNYVLPYTYSVHPNYTALGLQKGDLKHSEAVFQLSYKVRLWGDILGEDLDLYLAYTNRSFWQVYNKHRSSPFRETNHEPEVFLRWTDLWVPQFADHVQYNLGLVHQSNGRSDPFSRSWNRIYIFPRVQRGNFRYGLKLWYRLPEDKKRTPTDASGDDNPDIEHYMGNFELHMSYAAGRQTYTLMLRNNLDSDNKGAIELGYTFPINSNVYGYVQYFDGYGESLIDYNHHNRRLGIGLAFNINPT